MHLLTRKKWIASKERLIASILIGVPQAKATHAVIGTVYATAEAGVLLWAPNLEWARRACTEYRDAGSDVKVVSVSPEHELSAEDAAYAAQLAAAMKKGQVTCH